MLSWRSMILAGALLFFLVTITACDLLPFSQSVPRLGYEANPLSGQAYLVCSQACRDRGQCGEVVAGPEAPFTAVMVNVSGPATRNHSNIASFNSLVTIIETRDETVIAEPNSQNQFILRFYHINVPNLNLDGWVAGWCIADRPIE